MIDKDDLIQNALDAAYELSQVMYSTGVSLDEIDELLTDKAKTLEESADREKFILQMRKCMNNEEIEELYRSLYGDSERTHLLQDALKTVCKDRADEYGDMESNFDDIADLWTVYLGVKVERRDVANMMILLKVARNSTPGHRDNWVDIAGYAACGAEVDA